MFKRGVLAKTSQRLLLGVVLFSLVGIVNASLIIVKEQTSDSLICFGSNSCERVLSSSYAYVFGIPVVWLGIGFYVLMFLIGCGTLVSKSSVWRRTLLGLSSVGFLFSLYLFGVQWIALEAFCYYCIVSFIDATLIFVIALFLTKATSLARD